MYEIVKELTIHVFKYFKFFNVSLILLWWLNLQSFLVKIKITGEIVIMDSIYRYKEVLKCNTMTTFSKFKNYINL